MRYVLSLDNRTILNYWDCSTPEDFIDALTIYLHLKISEGTLTGEAVGTEWLDWAKSQPEPPTQPTWAARLVANYPCGKVGLDQGTLQWGPEGSWPHRQLKRNLG